MAKKTLMDLKNADESSLKSYSQKQLKKLTQIKYEGDNDALFWRFQADILNPKAEIIVPETHIVLFLKDGMLMDELHAGRYPIFDTKKSLFSTSKVGASTVDLIFISKTNKLKVLWGTANPFGFRDEKTDMLVHIRSNGEFEVRVKTPRKFYLECVGSDKNFSKDDLRARLQARLLSVIEPIIFKTLKEKRIPFEDVTQYRNDIADAIKVEIAKMFLEDYGLEVCSFIINAIIPLEEEIEKLEEARKEMREKEELKKTAKEIAEELERLEDKSFEREKILHELHSKDEEKYYEVLKVLGWPKVAPNVMPNMNVPSTPPHPAITSNVLVCPACGAKYNGNVKFCPNDGGKLVPAAPVCPSCKNKLPANVAFCPNCGHKVK